MPPAGAAARLRQCWLYIGHESEVPHAGDFRSRTVAGRPLILVRGDDSVVRVLLNTCTHRAAGHADRNRQRADVSMSYMHGPTTLAGSWSACLARTLIVKHSSATRWDCYAAKVDSYRGFVFACFDSGAIASMNTGWAREYWTRSRSI